MSLKCRKHEEALPLYYCTSSLRGCQRLTLKRRLAGCILGPGATLRRGKPHVPHWITTITASSAELVEYSVSASCQLHANVGLICRGYLELHSSPHWQRTLISRFLDEERVVSYLVPSVTGGRLQLPAPCSWLPRDPSRQITGPHGQSGHPLAFLEGSDVTTPSTTWVPDPPGPLCTGSGP